MKGRDTRETAEAGGAEGFTFNCRFSSASFSSSACCLLHFSRTFFNSASSWEAEPGAEVAVGSAFVEFRAEECNAGALLASTSFCSTEENKA